MQNNDILLSVVIPIYNREKTLSFAVDSVLKANSDRIELLLIDDGSTDSSGAICDEYSVKDKRVRVFHKENGGVSSARNFGTDHVQGKYIFFCDSDDQVYSDVLEKSLTYLADSDRDLYVFDYVYHNLNDDSEVRQKFDIPTETDLNKQDIVDKIIAPLVLKSGTGLASSCHKFFLTERIKQYNIRFEEKVFKGEDWRFVLDFADVAESMYYVPETLYRYNLDGTQTEKKYKKLAGYHLLGSPKRKLSLLAKYNLEYKGRREARLFSELISAVVFSVKNHVDNREIKAMIKDEYVQKAATYLRRLTQDDYYKYEISRKNKFYSYLILLKSVFLLDIFIKKANVIRVNKNVKNLFPHK